VVTFTPREARTWEACAIAEFTAEEACAEAEDMAEESMEQEQKQIFRCLARLRRLMVVQIVENDVRSIVTETMLENFEIVLERKLLR
jgi:hypothetical protein